MADSSTLSLSVFAFYIVMMASIAVRGYYSQKEAKKVAATNQGDAAHFLGQQDFGIAVIYLNMVATFVSGYVVVAVPDIASALGCVTFVFLGLCTSAGSMTPWWAQICRISKHRGYQGPNDFVADRYNSWMLRMLGVFAGVIFNWFFVAIEWMYLCLLAEAVFEPIIGLESTPENPNRNGKIVTWALAGFVYVCETVGGMSAVAITDAVQCGFLLLSFFSIPILIEFLYGGFDGIFGIHGTDGTQCANYKVIETPWGETPPSYGLTTLVGPNGTELQYYGNGTHLVHSGIDLSHSTVLQHDFVPIDAFDDLLKMHVDLSITSVEAIHKTETGCMIYNNPFLMVYPPRFMGWFMVFLAMGFYPFALAPATLHRVMVAESDEVLAKSLAPLHWFPIMFMLPGCLIGMTAAVIFPEEIEQGAFFATITHFQGLGSIYQVMASILLVSGIASFMSTGDSVVIAVSNLLVEDVWKGWIQTYFEPKSAAAAQFQNLVVAKVCSIIVIIGTVYTGVYAGLDMLQLLNLGIQGLWLLAPIYLGMWFSFFKGPAMLLGGMVSLPCAWYYEFRVYDFVESPMTSPVVCALIHISVCFIGSAVINSVFPDFHEHCNRGWLQFDSLENVTQHFGRMVDKPGTKMLGKNDKTGKWNTVKVKEPKRKIEGSEEEYFVVCDVFDTAGAVIAKEVRYNTKQLRGFMWSQEMSEDITMPLRNTWDTPLGLVLYLFVVLGQYYRCPLWDEEELEQEIVYGLPEWAFWYVAQNFVGTFFLSTYTWFLWRGADANGVSIVGTEKDTIIGKIWFLDLTISEIMTRGCRKRRDWILEDKTVADVTAWVRTLTSLARYAETFEENQVDGTALTKLTVEDLKEMGVVEVGLRHTMIRMVDEYAKQAYREYLKPGAFNAPQTDLEFLAGEDGQDFPRELKDVTVEWLSRVTGHTVKSFEVTPLEMGVASDLGLYKLNYSDSISTMNPIGEKQSVDAMLDGIEDPTKAGPPSSLVCKWSKGIPETREQFASVDSYKKEILFYEQLAHKVPFKAPDCYKIFTDAEKPDEFFCIVMEDMNTAGYKCLDQITGLTVNDLLNMNTLVAELHGKYWKDPLLEEDWLNPGKLTGEIRPFWLVWMDNFIANPQAAHQYEKSAIRMEELHPGKQTEACKWMASDEFIEIRTMISDRANCTKLLKFVNNQFASRPCTLLHADLRADNVFQSKTDPTKFTFIDFQMLMKGPPGCELVQLYVHALADVSDYSRLDEIIEDYYNKMLAASPPWVATEYTLEMCKDDFTLGTLLLTFGFLGSFDGVVEAMIEQPESPIWDLFDQCFKRIAACWKQIGTADRAKELFAMED